MQVVGALVGLVIALFVFDYVAGDGTLIDEVGDFIVNLTQSEETKLQQLEPVTQEMVRQLISDSQAQDGIRLHVGQTRRSPAQEKALVEAGKTSGTLKVSWHELGRAVDLYPDDGNGGPDLDGKNLDAFRTFQGRAVFMGFRSLAFNDDGSKHLIKNAKGSLIWDGGHVEWRSPYGSLAEAVSAEGTDEQKAALGVA